MSIRLPYPPTANSMYRAVAGRAIISAKYRAWQTEAILACRGAAKLDGFYRLFMTVTRPDKRRRDIDNLIKPTVDALVKAGIVEDDSKALSVYAEWLDVGEPGVLVTVTPP